MKPLQEQVTGKWFLLSLAVGITSGIGAIVFDVLGQFVSRFVLAEYAGYVPIGAKGENHLFHAPDTSLTFYGLTAVLVVGGLISGWLVYTFAPEAEGHGTDGAIDAFHRKRGNISFRVAIVKTLASAVTLGTGGSGGREGPIAQIGAALGSFLGRRLKLSARDRRILMAAGMGAGVGAIFRAPLAGAIFAGEIMYRDADLESDVIVPSAISSITAYSLYGLFLPADMTFSHVFGKLPNYTMNSLAELLPYGIMSLALSVVGILYIKCFYGLHDLFAKLPGPRHIRPAIGAFLAGLVAIGLYYGFGNERRVLAVLATGYGVLQSSLESPEKLSLTLLLTVAFFKILTTSLTISSGGSGGVFGPSMVIGGCLGVSAGKLLESLRVEYWHEFWLHPISPGAFGIVGMAGFFAGIARAPISTIIMVSEMTGSYQLLLPTMWVSTLCFLLCSGTTLYRKQVPTRLESPAHRGDFTVDVLEGIKVADAYRQDRKIELVPEAMPLSGIVKLLSETHQHYFPVVNDDGKMVGIFSSDDVRSYIYDETIWELADASDVMVSRFLSVSPHDDLNTAMRKFTSLNLDELPVIDPDEPGKLLGMLRRKETIAAYNRQLASRQEAIREQAE
ncbi:MAG: chloride channel protein [Planctomycetaceae bacterium]|nr:chloride channel protein [Planctomycetaceae bacterium]